MIARILREYELVSILLASTSIMHTLDIHTTRVRARIDITRASTSIMHTLESTPRVCIIVVVRSSIHTNTKTPRTCM